MGEICQPKPVLLILAAFSRYESALAWARRTSERTWGPVALQSDLFAFDDTAYYSGSMGTELKKRFFAFQGMIDPADLPERKTCSNRWEDEYGRGHEHAVERPLNLDPGYLTEAKLVLATTKDRNHRIYLSRGIYAEVTLAYSGRQWQAREWTYPDYRRPEYHEFFSRCRQYYRQRLGKAGVLHPG